MYLDRVHISQQSNNNSLIHVKRFGLNFFRSYSLMNASGLGKEMIEKLMKLVERIRGDRDGKESDLFVLAKQLIEMIRELEEYSQGELDFERIFIQRTWSFYEQESGYQIEKIKMREYLKYAWERLEYEEGTICSLLAPITKDKLMKCARERIILDQMTKLFPKPTGSSLKLLFEAEDFESLKLVYEMVNGVFGVESLAAEWTAFIRSHGQELMGRGNDFRTIEGIAGFKVKIDGIIKNCFQSDPVMQGTLKDAFETVMNGRGVRSAELLALYIHQRLQSAQMEDSAGNEAFLSMSLLLFRYLHSKEAFDAFYKRTLAQRLLFQHQNRDNLTLERHFVGKLREECGGGFVSRMESMLKDVEQSSEMTRAFRTANGSEASGINAVTGITVVSGLWPSACAHSTSTSGTLSASSTSSLTMPSELDKLETSFASFYTGQKKNCSLKWMEQLGSCVMRSTFKAGRYNLNLTVPQALILLRFNDKDNAPVSLTKLMEKTHMERGLALETLKSLSTEIYPIVVECGREEYKINEEFEYAENQKGATIPVYALQSPFLPVEEEIPSLLELSGDSTAAGILTTAPNVQSAILDRQYQVDSLLVRRMKHQQRCLRSDLVNYALANLGNVRVSAGDVEGRVEGLIEKEYMRMERDKETIVYLP